VMARSNYYSSWTWGVPLTCILILLSMTSCRDNKRQHGLEPLTDESFTLGLDAVLDFNTAIIDVNHLKDHYNNFTILDARDIYEYQISHLPDALHLGFEQPDWTLLDRIPKEDTLLIYCSVGYRSEKLINDASLKGIKAYNLYGGIFEWANRANTLIDSAGQPTKNIHAYSQFWKRFIDEVKLSVVY